MKLRNPWLISTAAWLGTWVLRGWMSSVRPRMRMLGVDCDPRGGRAKQRFIYTFWHEHLLMPAALFARSDIHVLISRHADGQLIAELVERMGFRTVRGSTTRGGTEAMLNMLEVSKTGHLGITPDGPRGPRRKAQLGAVFVASRSGLPIIPLGIAYSHAWRARSWDRFAVPKWGARGYLVTLDPIFVPPAIDGAALEHYRQRHELALHTATAIAEHWATTGVLDASPAYHQGLIRAKAA